MMAIIFSFSHGARLLSNKKFNIGRVGRSIRKSGGDGGREGGREAARGDLFLFLLVPPPRDIHGMSVCKLIPNDYELGYFSKIIDGV